MKKISYVIPCYRSEKTLESVITEIKETMAKLSAYSFEVVLVNDCSPDNTWQTIEKICKENSNIIGINLSKNFGQHAALMAGMRETKGDYVICLDDDGQTPANEVDKLLNALESGYDAVYARYGNKKHSAFRNMGSRMNELMARMMLGKPKELFVSSYFGVKRFVVEDMLRYQNSYPYVIGLVLRATKNIVNVDVTHREREEGKSGYTLKKLLGLWFNGFTAFSVTPLRIATVIGVFCAFIGFLYAIYVFVRRLISPTYVLGFSSLMCVILFVGGMLMIMLGLVGEYIGRIYISLNNSPQYVIREKVGNKEE